ncbi:LPS assembly lipoprotein LptE [Alteromonas sp. 14N.309.X.WAT.G.H12]|uniref:LPS-assembly lipoprotein LptE n=1 Tax=Alteromonas sp. 14N.309.X.WAT.G.H12 TaxID=3120824 RepID=UPI002FD578DB
MHKLLIRLCLFTALLSLTSCGFHLRGNQVLPPSVNFVAMASTQAHSPLARALKKRLKVYSIEAGTVAESPSMNTSVLINIEPEKLERRLLSLFASGQVAEYELIYGVGYTVTFPDKEPIKAYFEVLRDYQDDPEQVLAKSRELELIVSEMRDEAADKIIRRLTTQASQSTPEL